MCQKCLAWHLLDWCERMLHSDILTRGLHDYDPHHFRHIAEEVAYYEENSNLMHSNTISNDVCRGPDEIGEQISHGRGVVGFGGPAREPLEKNGGLWQGRGCCLWQQPKGAA